MFQVFIDDERNEWTADMFCSLDDAVSFGLHRLRAHGAVRFDVLDRRGELVMCNMRLPGQSEAEIRDRIRRGW